MKKKYVAVFGAVLMVVLIGAIFILGNAFGKPEAVGGLLLDENAQEWEPEQAIASEDAQGIQIPGYGTVVFPSNEQEVSMTLYNPKENTCIFQFSLYIDDEDTPIYTSEGIEPGKAVQEITLNRALSKGEYTLRIQIDPYDAQSGAKHNNAIVTASLQVI